MTTPIRDSDLNKSLISAMKHVRRKSAAAVTAAILTAVTISPGHAQAPQFPPTRNQPFQMPQQQQWWPPAPVYQPPQQQQPQHWMYMTPDGRIVNCYNNGNIVNCF